MAELKSYFGLHAFRKHGFMVNSWLLVVCLGHMRAVPSAPG